MKKTIKECMTNETVITVLAIIAVLLTLVMIYYGWILALVVGCAILGAAMVEALSKVLGAGMPAGRPAISNYSVQIRRGDSRSYQL